ncbi:MAG TPA: recombinase family protein [Candidatus Tectomicrobia bacterium]
MFVGYARVSLPEQHLALQTDALQRAGCERLYTDTVSGGQAERPGLRTAREVLRAGDTFVVWKLDRLGRSLSHLVDTIQDLHQQGIHFKSLQENIDTTSGAGKLVFHLFAALAEFERDLIRERTRAGLAAARERGKLGGRTKALRPHQAARVRALYNARELSVPEICVLFGIGKTTVYRYLQHPARRDTAESRTRSTVGR